MTIGSALALLGSQSSSGFELIEIGRSVRTLSYVPIPSSNDPLATGKQRLSRTY